MTILLVCVWLGACNRSDEQTNGRSDPETRAESGYFDTYGVIDGADVSSSALRNVALGTCTDERQFIADCEAPFAEPESPTQPEAIPPETICTATRDPTGLLVNADATAAGPAHAPITVQFKPLLATSTLGKRCGKVNSSLDFATNRKSRTPGESTICLCGMKLCMCG